MAILYVGIDLAKSQLAVHGVDEAGKPALVRPAVRRAALMGLVAKLPVCTIGMVACSGAHLSARQFAYLGQVAHQRHLRWTSRAPSGVIGGRALCDPLT